MYAFALHFEHLGVAGLASLVSGENHRFFGNLGNGRGPVVTLLSKAARDKKSARHQEQQGPHEEDPCHAEKVP